MLCIKLQAELLPLQLSNATTMQSHDEQNDTSFVV